jgi:surfeit locus 1 family protein
LTPLTADQGFVVLVNRGFVPQGMVPTRNWSRSRAAQTVTGLLRLSEPKGGFLRANDPVADRWRSRDVAAIAAARGLAHPVAPYFIDAVAGAPDAWPRGGLTRLDLPNSHLVYALTWFALCALCLFGAWRVLRDDGDRDVAEEVPAAS